MVFHLWGDVACAVPEAPSQVTCKGQYPPAEQKDIQLLLKTISVTEVPFSRACLTEPLL